MNWTSTPNVPRSSSMPEALRRPATECCSASRPASFADLPVAVASPAPHSGRVPFVLDGSPTHCSGAVWKFAHEQNRRLWLEYLPDDTSKLNPIEYPWSLWKQHELPNFLAITLGPLNHHDAERCTRWAVALSQCALFGTERNSTGCNDIGHGSRSHPDCSSAELAPVSGGVML